MLSKRRLKKRVIYVSHITVITAKMIQRANIIPSPSCPCSLRPQINPRPSLAKAREWLARHPEAILVILMLHKLLMREKVRTFFSSTPSHVEGFLFLPPRLQLAQPAKST